MKDLIVIWGLLVAGTVVLPNALQPLNAQNTFDHNYRAYQQLLRTHTVDTRVDYAQLKSSRADLDEIVVDLGQVTETEFLSWSREEQIAYWINAYNIFTLQAIVNHYPIRWQWHSLFTLAPRNSIKQIRGVWTELSWKAAGLTATLDEIEHKILRPKYREPRIHFAINCASLSCPPLRAEPYVGIRLERQLILAARNFLASKTGTQVDGSTLWVSKIFDWYGDDFLENYGYFVDGRSDKQKAILGTIAKYGPPQASQLAQAGTSKIRYLRYDWRLNDSVDSP